MPSSEPSPLGYRCTRCGDPCIFSAFSHEFMHASVKPPHRWWRFWTRGYDHFPTGLTKPVLRMTHPMGEYHP